MLRRVDIENLVIVERASFEPGAGLTAITGETGAGKTLLATAISLLFGGDADAGHVGPGGPQAWVEGEFDVDDAFWDRPEVEALTSVRPDHDSPLVLARRVDASGRSRALAWGRTVAKSDLAAAGRLLLATAGQHVQVRLKSQEYQRATLDSAGDVTHTKLLADMRTSWTALATARAARDRVVEIAAAGDERLDQLRDDLQRIDAVSPTVEDERELTLARDRARNHAALVESLAASAGILDSDGGAIDLAGRAYAALGPIADIDPEVAALAQDVMAGQQALGDAASQLRSRLDDLTEGPRAIDDIEDRLATYDELHRRFGGTTESVLAAQVRMAEELATFEDASGALAASEAAVAKAEKAAAKVADKLSASRCALADRVGADVVECLRELGMGGSVFRVQVEEAELGATGSDRIDLLLAPSAEIEPRPVAQVASGGELSRIALSLLVATSDQAAQSTGTILFDEIDAGIGGHTAHAVAKLLRRLADRQQVLCITHLPQVAARADSHVVIEKSASGGDTVRTKLVPLPDEAAVEAELVRMLGADHDDDAALVHVRQLRGSSFTPGSTATLPVT